VIFALNLQSIPLFCLGVAIIAVCILISLPLMIELISQRVGTLFLNAATSFVYLTSATVTSILTYVFGALMDEETKASSIRTLLVAAFLFAISLCFGLYLLCSQKTKFRGLHAVI